MKKGFKANTKNRHDVCHGKRDTGDAKSGSAAEGLAGPVGVIELEGDSGNGDGEGGDVRNRVEILST